MNDDIMKTHQEKHLAPKQCLQLKAPEKRTAEEYSENSVVTCLVWSGMAPRALTSWLPLLEESLYFKS